jgi:hypothetical protein
MLKAVAMSPKRVLTLAFGALLLAGAGSAVADEYRAGELLGLDLSQAVLSPKRLGPETRFAPVAVEARSDVAPKPVKTTRIAGAKMAKMAKPHVAARTRPTTPPRTKLARHHSNPLDAQAMDTRIQTWPCKSGGICNWKR